MSKLKEWAVGAFIAAAMLLLAALMSAAHSEESGLLPVGTKVGIGWVCDSEATGLLAQKYQESEAAVNQVGEDYIAKHCIPPGYFYGEFKVNESFGPFTDYDGEKFWMAEIGVEGEAWTLVWEEHIIKRPHVDEANNL